MSLSSLTAQQLDALKEVANICVGASVSEIAELFQIHVEMSVPSVEVVNVTHLFEKIGDPNEEMYTIFLRYDGKLNGNTIFLFKKQDLNSLFGPIEKEQEMLEKLSSISMTSSNAFIESLSQLTEFTVKEDSSHVAFDLLGAIVQYGFLEYCFQHENILLIQNSFTLSDIPLTGHFIFFPSPDNLHYLLSQLGVLTDGD